MTVDEIVDKYVRRMFGAGDAYRNDPLYHAQVKWLRRMLCVVDMAMDDEGVASDVRERVLRVTLYGSAGHPDEALDRVAERAQLAERMSREVKWPSTSSLLH